MQRKTNSKNCASNMLFFIPLTNRRRVGGDALIGFQLNPVGLYFSLGKIIKKKNFIFLLKVQIFFHIPMKAKLRKKVPMNPGNNHEPCSCKAFCLYCGTIPNKELNHLVYPSKKKNNSRKEMKKKPCHL